MGTKVHSQNFDLAVGGTDICAEQADLRLRRDLVEATNNCDSAKAWLVGKPDGQITAQGALETGAGSTEATLWAAWSGAVAVTFEFDPDGTGVASATNPLLSGSAIWNELTYQFGVTRPLSYTASAQVTTTVARDIT